jgi:hypothetical protein
MKKSYSLEVSEGREGEGREGVTFGQRWRRKGSESNKKSNMFVDDMM